MITSLSPEQVTEELKSAQNTISEWISTLNPENKENQIPGFHFYDDNAEQTGQEDVVLKEVLTRFIGEMKLTAIKLEALVKILGNE